MVSNFVFVYNSYNHLSLSLCLKRCINIWKSNMSNLAIILSLLTFPLFGNDKEILWMFTNFPLQNHENVSKNVQTNYAYQIAYHFFLILKRNAVSAMFLIFQCEKWLICLLLPLNCDVCLKKNLCKILAYYLWIHHLRNETKLMKCRFFIFLKKNMSNYVML